MKLKNAGNLLLSIGIALFFLAAAGFKLVGAPEMVGVFKGFGLPIWFMNFTAMVEISGAVGLVFYRHAAGFLGALVLSVTMLVASGLHLVFDPFGKAVPALVLMVLCGILAYLRRGLFFKAKKANQR